MHIAARHGNVKMVKMLLEDDANLVLQSKVRFICHVNCHILLI